MDTGGASSAGQQNKTKIRSLDELVNVAEQSRATGQRIVLAHGTFDLLHLGHLRHLEEALRQGDRLFVTVTADDFVNKGPGRPVFPELLRAEMLAALSCVDWVAVNNAATSVNVINTLKPDVYVKGVEYQSSENDVTGKILEEQAAVEAYGGRIHFTDDIVFSSSSLINRHFELGDPKLRAYLESARQRGYMEQIRKLLERISNMRVLLVGEAIIDEYHYVASLGKPPKEFVLATLLRGQEIFAGGIVAAANHVAGFCNEVEILTGLGARDSYEQVIRQSLKPNVKLWAVHRPEAPTVRKIRYVDADYLRKLFEVYVMDDSALSADLESRFEEEIVNRAKDFDVVIVTDFGHGLLSPRLRAALIKHSRFLAANAQSNAANHGFNRINKYSNADYICIDLPEAQLAVADKNVNLAEAASSTIRQGMNVDKIVITEGRNGCIALDKTHGACVIPAFTTRILDTMGAGDAFLAITAPLSAVADEMELVGFVGNAVGAMKVGIVGHRQSVEKIALLKYMQTLLK